MKKRIVIFVSAVFLGLVSYPQAAVQPANNGPTGRVAQEIARMENAAGGLIGVGAIHLESGESVYYHQDVRFPMGSAYKIPIAVQLLSRVEKGEIKLADMINLGKTDLHPGSGTISRMLNKPGVVLSLHNLLELMLLVSDNSATDLCITSAGGTEAVTQKMRELGIEEIDINRSTELLYFVLRIFISTMEESCLKFYLRIFNKKWKR